MAKPQRKSRERYTDLLEEKGWAVEFDAADAADWPDSDEEEEP